MGNVRYAVAGQHLQVTAGGTTTSYDDATVRLGGLELYRTDDGWTVVDAGVPGGAFHGGCRIQQLALRPGVEVRLALGGRDCPQIALLPVDPAQETLTIGRGAGNDVVLDDPVVSRRHAVIALAEPPVVRDLGSFNGTYVNGERVAQRALETGDQVSIGRQTFRWDGVALSRARPESGRRLVAERLTTAAADGRRLLEDASFELSSSTLTAVIGPSGSGKTTLLRALTGLAPAGRGRVLWDGHDLYRHYEELRFQVGVVPQEEILHPQLTVRQGLTYAARLRLPPDTGAAERDHRVAEVIRRLGLVDRQDHRIGSQLSGGQRKRVSIATELLTAPPMLFLDEPTSGLDPGLDRSVMEHLRDLADDDRLVVVVTHSVLALDLCDTVVVLARGGRVAYVGPPDGVLDEFGCADYPELFALLESGVPALRSRGSTDSGPVPPVRRVVVPPRRPSRMRQLATLVSRDLAVLRADRTMMAMLVLLPLVLAALSRVVQGGAGLSLRATRDAAGVVDGAEAGQRLTILVIAAALMGAAMTIREVVKERAILRREYAVGLSPGLYLASKVLVLGGACALQGLVVTWLALVGLPGPDRGGVHGWGLIEVALPVAALAATMAVVGLAVSARLRSADHAMPILVAIVMSQLVLSSAIVGVAGRPVLEQLSWLAPARWAYAATGITAHLERANRGVPDAVRDPLRAYSATQWNLDLAALAGLAALALVVGLVAVRRRARG